MIDSTVSNEEILLRISGELKQKIARVRSHSSQLQQAFGGTMDAEHQQWFDAIEKDCLDLNSIIHNLISLDNQYDEHQHPLQVDTVHLNRFLTAYVADYTSEPAQSKHVQVSYEDIDESIHIHIDPQAISEALSHILSNAIKFSPTETQIVIKLVRYANVANLSISDQGIGIPKKLRPYLFKKFSKATRRGTDGEESTGLGLYLTRSIIEKHQGSVWLESEEGRGTNVYINLPIREKIM
ncbi:MAG: HAMP domain-containing sensor histidine kinase [Tunicatimonas sp.]